MCEAYPGPRCSPEMKKKMDNRYKKLSQVKKHYGEASPEYVKAEAYYIVARNHYDATPKGLEELTKLIQANPDSEQLLTRYIKANNTRKMQQNAFSEIKQGRQNSIATIYTELQDFYSKEEILTIVNSAREYEEKQTLLNPTFTINETSQEEYDKYLKTLEDTLNVKYGNNIPANIKEELNNLKNLNTPDNVNLQTYVSLNNKIELSRKQLTSEIVKIGNLNNVPPRVAASFFDSYRQQYNIIYYKLPESQRPDPPEKWLTSELGVSGLKNSPNTNLIPTDPATVYALYRLRSDPHAIPDYLKKRKNIISLTFTPTEADKTLLNASIFTPNGVKLKSYTRTIGNDSNASQGNKTLSWGEVKPEIIKMLENKTLISDNLKTTVETLKTKVAPQIVSETPNIDIIDMCRKHYDLPDLKLSTIMNETLNAKQPKNVEDKSTLFANLFFKTLKNVEQTWKQKPSRKAAQPIESITISRWNTK